MNRPGWPVTDPLMKGDAAMTQGMIVSVLLIGLVGLIWVIVLDIHDHSHDKRQGSVSPEPRDGTESLDAHPGSQRLRPDKGT